MNASREKVINLLKSNVQRTPEQINNLIALYLTTQEEFDNDDLLELIRVLSMFDMNVTGLFSVKDLRVNAAFEFDAYTRGCDELLNLIYAIRKSSPVVSNTYMKMVLYTHLITGGCPFKVLRMFFLWDGQLSPKEITDCTNMFMQYDWRAETICNLVDKNISVSRLLPELVRLQSSYEGTVQFNDAWVKRTNAKLTIRSHSMLSEPLPKVPAGFPINKTIFSVERSWKYDGNDDGKSIRQRFRRRC